MRSFDSYPNEDKDAVNSVNTFDIRSINWKLKVKAICCVIEDYVETTRTTKFELRSSRAVLSIKDDLSSFYETLGDADQVSAMNPATRRLETMILGMF